MSFYVRRSKPDLSRRGWVGPIRSKAQAEREADAWRGEGWDAVVCIATPAVKEAVRLWVQEARHLRRQSGQSSGGA